MPQKRVQEVVPKYSIDYHNQSSIKIGIACGNDFSYYAGSELFRIQTI